MIKAWLFLLIYIWIAAAIWHFIPTEQDAWWAIPAMMTTAFLGIISLWCGFGD